MKRGLITKAGLKASSVLLCLAGWTPAFAQAQNAPASAPAAATAASTNSGIADIVVTAQKREEKLQRVPITITAVTANALATSGIQNTDELPHLAAGLTTSRGLGAGNYFFPFIRGVGSAITANGVEASVATYLDGVYQADKQANILDLDGIDRVEVLKGPQGTLFGRNATGGAINVVTATPTDVFAAHGSISYGRFDETVERGYLNGGITGNLAGNISIVARQGGDYLFNVPTDQHFGGTNSVTINAKLKWRPTDRLTITPQFIYSKRTTSDVGANLVAAPGTVPLATTAGGVTSYKDYTTNLTNIPKARTEGYQGNLTARYAFGSMDLVSISSIQRNTNFNLLDYDLTQVPFFGFELNSSSKIFTQEVQLVSTSNSRFQWVVGGYYISSNEHYDPLIYSYAGPGGTPVDIDTHSPTKGIAGFAQGTLLLGDSTHATVGLRYSHEKKGLSGDEYLPDANNFVIAGPINLSANYNKLTWRLSLDHQFTPDLMGFVSYNRGFKSGGFNSTDIGPQDALKPEVLDAYEAGLKSQLLDRRLQINVSGYYYSYKDIQVSRVGDGGANVLQSAGAAHLYGLDAEFVYKPVRNFQLNGGINWEHTNYTSFANASGFVISADGTTAVPTIFSNIKGAQILNAPNVTFNVGATWSLDLGQSGSIDISPNYAYNSRYNQLPGQFYVSSNGFLNGTITWNLPGNHFTASIWGRNLTNVRSLGLYPTAFGISEQTIRPVSYGITLGAKL